MKQERMRLYNMGMTDRQIADATGESRVVISNWRYRNGLPAINPRPKRDLRCKYDEITNLYNQGYSDSEIGAVVGVDAHYIYNWRHHKGLPPNVPPQVAVPMEKALTPDQCEDMRAFLHSLIRCTRGVKKPNVMAFIKACREIGLASGRREAML